ncbi:uncharacterized protein LOC144505356 [Mustelus asterias]
MRLFLAGWLKYRDNDEGYLKGRQVTAVFFCDGRSGVYGICEKSVLFPNWGPRTGSNGLLLLSFTNCYLFRISFGDSALSSLLCSSNVAKNMNFNYQFRVGLLEWKGCLEVVPSRWGLREHHGNRPASISNVDT